MRLIDADKLRAQYKDPKDIRDSAKAMYHVTGIWAGIDAAESVEAIPVKDLERIAKVLRNSREYELRVVGNAIPGIVSAWKEEQEGK